MLELSTALRVKRVTKLPALIERVRDRISELGCGEVWARAAGAHVLIGLRGSEAYARLTPLGGASFGLSFRGVASESSGWDPLLLVDTLCEVVEHALVAGGALPDEPSEPNT